METIPLFGAVQASCFPDLVAHHATRRGGVSNPPFDSLNLGFSTQDDPACVVENRARFAAAVGAPLERWVVVGQVHGADLLRADPSMAGAGARSVASLTPADAIFLPEPGVFALALSADCPLVAIVDPETRRAGIAHAGWRGTAAGVVQRLLAEFRDAGSPMERCLAATSPGICGPCYEVGDEVFAAMDHLPGVSAARRGRYLDLRRVHRAILEHAGIPGDAVTRSRECSACLPQRHFSHRRDAGRTGRGGALVGWHQPNPLRPDRATR